MGANDPFSRDSSDERILALLTAAEHQQRAVQGLLGDLAGERAGLARLQQELREQLEQVAAVRDKMLSAVKVTAPYVAKAAAAAAKSAVREGLEGVSGTAIKAIAEAAKPTIQSIDESSRAAVTQQLRIEDAQRRFARQWSWIVAAAVAAMIVAAAVVAYGTTWWQQREIAQLQQQREQLQAQVDELRSQVDQTVKAGRRSKP
jgi:cell division protein FtsL/uncharacterized coiled-coil protein SlyX